MNYNRTIQVANKFVVNFMMSTTSVNIITIIVGNKTKTVRDSK